MHEDSIGIGELAARTGLSHKALRLYGDRGLLPPAHVDPRTGFRRYRPEQVERARRIALLRAAGMPLALIAGVLAPGGAESVRLLDAYWRGERSVHEARREAVGYAREVLAGRNPRMYEMAERDVPEQKVLFIRRHVTAGGLPDFLGEATGAIFAHLRTSGACLSGPLFAVYHGIVSDDSDGPVEVCVPTADTVGPVGEIGVRIEPAHREAYTELGKKQRDFATMVGVHDAVLSWIREQGYEPTGGSREVYYPNWETAEEGEHVADVAGTLTTRGGKA
ncbi:MerR family transcriptional regulator [Kitasatospora sp. A2-31]|uniref:MerR family transcriptional regulator n=1 Tax=Kitasatospora sp. A2-31 TaxID=2916414 RepID=UPI001EEA5FD3|nr:MerR family transcriptional regulator [Kitasatospora sp. A2-31]MCG6496452.1 MerR family transcriptional regulator [Kitasatospora sp. A2-31]